MAEFEKIVIGGQEVFPVAQSVKLGTRDVISGECDSAGRMCVNIGENSIIIGSGSTTFNTNINVTRSLAIGSSFYADTNNAYVGNHKNKHLAVGNGELSYGDSYSKPLVIGSRDDVTLGTNENVKIGHAEGYTAGSTVKIGNDYDNVVIKGKTIEQWCSGGTIDLTGHVNTYNGAFVVDEAGKAILKEAHKDGKTKGGCIQDGDSYGSTNLYSILAVYEDNTIANIIVGDCLGEEFKYHTVQFSLY